MRMGVTEENKSLFLEISKIAEQEGIQMMTLHPTNCVTRLFWSF